MYNKEWDNLIILDACRLNVFKQSEYVAQLDGTLNEVRSNGSGSVEFLHNTFGGRQCNDTVYITANPHVLTELDSPFHTVDHVWDNDWDEDTGTVHPDTMVEHAVAAHRKYPNKRLIVHFMQPHYPFIGQSKVKSDGLNLLRTKARGEDSAGKTDRDVWAQLYNGEVTQENVWNAYRDNLNLAIEAVRDLIRDINGLSVITADHGNAFGERAWPIPIRVFGHPNGINIDALRVVPWFECEFEERRNVEASEKPTVETGANSRTTERLEALGYR